MAGLRPQHEPRGRERAMNNHNPEGYFFFTTGFASIRPRRTRPGQAALSGVRPRKKTPITRMERPNRPPAAAVAGPPLPEMNLACRRQAAPDRRRAACRETLGAARS